MNDRTKRMTAMAMLCAIAYVVMLVGRIPIVLFLQYDPKDVVITLGGMIWGPATACMVSVAVSWMEMLSVSETGLLGCMMNVVSTCSFACTAAAIYRKRQTRSGAGLGLAAGSVTMVAVMLLWNYWVTPLYMGYPREAVAGMLLPVFLPFNVLKAGLNAACTLWLYRPAITACRKSGCMPNAEGACGSGSAARMLWAALMMASCVMGVLAVRAMR